MKQIEPTKFVELLSSSDIQNELCIIDVREQGEWDYYHLEKSTLIPMNSIPSRLEEIPDDRDVYVVCAHGVRSEMVCGYLENHGKDNVINVRGGMAAIAELLGFQYD